jgi:hypothetical protein
MPSSFARCSARDENDEQTFRTGAEVIAYIIKESWRAGEAK